MTTAEDLRRMAIAVLGRWGAESPLVLKVLIENEGVRGHVEDMLRRIAPPLYDASKAGMGALGKTPFPRTDRHRAIICEVGFSAADFVVNDRARDIELPSGSIQEAIAQGEITEGEIVQAFQGELVNLLRGEQ